MKIGVYKKSGQLIAHTSLSSFVFRFYSRPILFLQVPDMASSECWRQEGPPAAQFRFDENPKCQNAYAPQSLNTASKLLDSRLQTIMENIW